MRGSPTMKSPRRRDWPRAPSARRWRAPGAAWSKHIRREARLNMSHVDEGTLHAYLDGELTPVERERVDTHLKGCPACQARLAEEQAILERASRLLGLAAPPERAMPPLAQLHRPPVIWRLRRPLAWAATLILAVGLGWYVRGTFPDRAASQREVQADQALASKPASAANAPPVAGPGHDNPMISKQPEARLDIRQAVPNNASLNKEPD